MKWTLEVALKNDDTMNPWKKKMRTYWNNPRNEWINLVSLFEQETKIKVEHDSRIRNEQWANIVYRVCFSCSSFMLTCHRKLAMEIGAFLPVRQDKINVIWLKIVFLSNRCVNFHDHDFTCCLNIIKLEFDIDASNKHVVLFLVDILTLRSQFSCGLRWTWSK